MGWDSDKHGRPGQNTDWPGRPPIGLWFGVMSDPPQNLPRYRLLSGSDDAHFCRRVSDALQLGYELYGPPAISLSDDSVRVAQAVVWPDFPEVPPPSGRQDLEDHGYEWGNGCRGWRLHDAPDLSVIEEWLPGRTSERWHLHERSAQLYYVLRGEATVTVDGVASELGAGDSIAVSAGSAHVIGNAGDRPLRVLVISAPTTRGDRRDL